MARVPRRPRGGRRPKKPHHGGPRIRRLIPVKPRKPASGFNIFVRDYFRTAMARNFRTAPEAMTYAGQFWRNHPNQKQQYLMQARPERARFQATFRDYAEKKKLLKRPGNAFIFFVKDYWQREGRGKPVWQVGREAGVIWKTMTGAQKQPFSQAADRAKAAHNQMITNLTSGQARFEDYMRTPAGIQQAQRAATTAVNGAPEVQVQ